MWVNWVVCCKKCKVFTFHETFLIFFGVSRKISQGPKCTFQIWKCPVIGLRFFSAHFSRRALGRIVWWAKRMSAGEASCGTASLQSNCPNQDRSQVTCLFPSRVSVSRTIKPVLETGCCAKQRPPDFFSQKVILFCVTGIKWIIHSEKPFKSYLCFILVLYRATAPCKHILRGKSSIILKGWLEWSPNWLLIDF